MSRQIRISIEDDEVFERLKRRKDALDLSWEDALRRGLRDSAEPPRGQRTRHAPGTTPGHHSGANPDHRREPDRFGRDRGGPRRRRSHRSRDDPSPFDPDFGERIVDQVLTSLGESLPGVGGEPLDREIDRLEDAEDAELVLGERDGERVPLRVSLYTGPDGLDVEVVAVRSGKHTEGMNRFADGARGRVARRFADGETATLELDGGGETYEVRPDLTWARGPDDTPMVTDVTIREVVFEER